MFEHEGVCILRCEHKGETCRFQYGDKLLPSCKATDDDLIEVEESEVL